MSGVCADYVVDGIYPWLRSYPSSPVMKLKTVSCNALEDHAIYGIPGDKLLNRRLTVERFFDGILQL